MFIKISKYILPAENALDEIEYSVYNSACAQYFRYMHPLTHILYSKQWFPIWHDHTGSMISENDQKIDFFFLQVKIVNFLIFWGKCWHFD